MAEISKQESLGLLGLCGPAREKFADIQKSARKFAEDHKRIAAAGLAMLPLPFSAVPAQASTVHLQKDFGAAQAVQYRMIDLGNGTASDVSANGKVVGLSRGEGYLWQNGVRTYLPMLPNCIQMTPKAINNNGDVVGLARQSSYGYVAFLWHNGTMTNLGTMLGGLTGDLQVNDINESGQVVGVSRPLDNQGKHAFLWENGATTDLGTLSGCTSSSAFSINASGQVVGVSSALTSNSTRAFLWQNGTMNDLGTLGGSTAYAYGINDSGQIAGYSKVESGWTHACMWENGTITDLGTLPGYSNSIAYAINTGGQVVGYSTGQGLMNHATLWSNGTITDLGALSIGYSKASSISDTGWICGESYTPEGIHAVVWQPLSGPTCAISNKAAFDPIMTTGKTNFDFKVFGKVTVVNSTTFTVDDGSGKPVTVVTPFAYSGITTGDFAAASGYFTGEGPNRVLNALPSKVVKLN